MSSLERHAIHAIAEKGGLIIDAGGAGPFTKGLAQYRDVLSAADYRTLDVSAEAKPDIVGDIHALPFDDESVDAFLCRSVLEHVRSPEVAIAEMRRALKPGGQLLLTVPSIYPYHSRGGDGGYPDLWRFFPDTLHMLLAGFSAVKITQRGGPMTAVTLFVPRLLAFRDVAERIDARLGRTNATVLVAWARR